MKELLYIAILLLLVYIIYIEKSVINLAIVVVSIIVLIMYMFKYKYKYVESFVMEDLVADTTVLYNDIAYEENLPNNLKTGLVYYVSSFDKRFIDFENNALTNHINNQIGVLFTQNLAGFPYDYYNQYDGIKITNRVSCANAKNTLESFETFSIFWYMKLITSKSNFESESTSYSLLQFDHGNIETSSSKLLDIRFVFKNNALNPSIEIYIANTILDIKYEYTIDDYYNNKIFADNKYHMFTFVKENGKVYFYMDNHLLINCNDENCFNKTALTLYGDDVEIKIRNDSFIRLNDNTNLFLKFNLNAFGIYRNTALTMDKIKSLNEYLINVKQNLSPSYLSLTQANMNLQNELERYTKPCPFSNNQVCSSRECYGVQNWRNADEIVGNSECVNKIVSYCDDLQSYDNDRICGFMKKDNIFKMATAIDSNLFMYNSANTQGNLNSNINAAILSQLDRLGLKNIYLDKSYRDNNGRYSGEMERLINDLLETNQTIDLNVIESLYSGSSNNASITSTINYDDLLNNPSFSNANTYIDMYNALLAQERMPTISSVTSNLVTSSSNAPHASELQSDLIDLNYDDIGRSGIYDNILQKHREDKIEKEISNNPWNFLNWWL